MGEMTILLHLQAVIRKAAEGKNCNKLAVKVLHLKTIASQNLWPVFSRAWAFFVGNSNRSFLGCTLQRHL